MRALHNIHRSRRAITISLAVVLIIMTVLGLAYALPSRAASHMGPHLAKRLPAPAHAVTVTASSTDWPMFGNNPAHTGVNASEGLLSPSTATGLSLVWSVDLTTICSGCQIWRSPAVAGGIVYVEAYQPPYTGKLYALNEMTGRLIWSYTTPGYLIYTPAVANGVVYIYNNYIGGLQAFNETTGKLLWATTGNFGGSSPTVVNGVVYLGAAAVSATTHKLLWNHTGDDCTDYFPPAVANGVVYILTSFGHVCALDAITGALLWDYNKPVGVKVDSAPAVANGVVYAYGQALDATTGNLLWNWPGSGTVMPAVANGIVYNGAYAYDATTGALLWSNTSASGVDAAVANGVVYVGGYAFNATTGAVLWSYPAAVSLSGAVVANDRVIVNSFRGGSVFAFQSAIQPLTTGH